MEEFVPILVLMAVVIIVAYVARRAQTVGLPPGVTMEGQRDRAGVSSAVASARDQPVPPSQLGRYMPSTSSAPRNRRRTR
jgi:hypothetical protein